MLIQGMKRLSHVFTWMLTFVILLNEEEHYLLMIDHSRLNQSYSLIRNSVEAPNRHQKDISYTSLWNVDAGALLHFGQSSGTMNLCFPSTSNSIAQR